MIVLITGNPVEGLEFYGPFDSPEVAITWGEDMMPNNDWWVTEITSPARFQV